MGQAGAGCCSTLTDNQQYVHNSLLLINQSQFELSKEADTKIPFLQQKVQNLSQQNIFKHKKDPKYFIGKWQQGQAQGIGALYIPDNVFYQGEFKKGAPEGQGQMQFLSKDQEFKGSFKNGKANGEGLFKNNKKHFTFQGQWDDSKPQNGILIFENNANILKIQIKDYKSRIAHISYRDGRQYFGQIDPQKFIPQGQGQLKFLDQSTYKGSWKNGNMHGTGLYEWKDGSKYQGNYLNGKKQGLGTFFYHSDKKYVGMWVNGKQQGEGKIIGKDGEIKKQGIWADGKFQKNSQIQNPKQNEINQSKQMQSK